MNDFELKLARFSFSLDNSSRRRLWTKLARLLSNGVPILDALGSIHQRRVDSGNARDFTTLAIGQWVERMRNGQRLGQAIEGWAPQDEQMLIAAGEQSGKLDEALIFSTEVMQAKSNIRSAVISGVAYPAFLLAVALGVLIMFSYKVIPEFSRVVPDDAWHGVARVMIDLASFTRDWIALIVIVIVALIVGILASFPRWSDGWRVKFDRYPPYSIYRVVQGSTWMISLAALVAAGVRIESALEQLGKNAPKWLSARIQACLSGMRSGQTMGDALARSGYEFPDREIIDDLGVYSRLSGFDQALATLGKEWIEESVREIQRMMKVVFGVSVLLVGLFVAFMVGGLIGMELQMTSIVQGSYR